VVKLQAVCTVANCSRLAQIEAGTTDVAQLPGRYPACVNGRKAGGIDADLMRINRALVPIEIKVRVVGEADDRVSDNLLSDGRL